MSSLEKSDCFEWRITDDETLERMFRYFQKDIHSYMMWEVQQWRRGLYSKDNRLFLTSVDTRNGCLFRTGGDADNWFYTYFLVLLVDENGNEVEGEATWQDSLGGHKHKCSVSDTLKDYQEIIARMMEVYQSEKDYSLKYGSEQENEAHDAKIRQYRSELDALVEEYRQERRQSLKWRQEEDKRRQEEQ